MKISRVRLLVAASAVALLAGFVGVVQTVTAQGTEPPIAADRERSAKDAITALPAHVRVGAERVGLRLDTSRKIAANLYLVDKRDGQLCMVSTASGMSMGCGPKNDFFGGSAVHYGIDERGSADAPLELTISGVARPDVKSVQVAFPSGPSNAAITTDGGFSITATKDQLASGRPTQLVALGENGRVIQAFKLPQG
ncbi:MAG TPA: hypothetical protein VF230_16530 [Acidimicrobiales bacterium]